MQYFKLVNQHTRAGKNGKEIYCPKCHEIKTVHNFSFEEIKCEKCEKFVDKYEWKVEE